MPGDPCRLPGSPGMCPRPPGLSGAGCPRGCALAGRALASAPAPAGASSGGAAGWSWAAAQAGAQCHPVTACDLPGDSGVQLAQLRWLCCKGFEQPGRPRVLEDVGKTKKPAVLQLCD